MANKLWELFVEISGDNSKYKRVIKDSQADLGAFEKTAIAATSKIGDAFALLGPRMTAAGIGAFILNTGRDFEKASAIISRSTGEVGDNLAALNGSLKTIYAQSGRSAEEIAGAIAKVRVETHLGGSALESLVSANLKFAKVTQSEVAPAIDQTQVLFQNWGVATNDQKEALDVLYGTMTQAGMGLSDLTGQMTSLGPTARAFGLSFVDTAAIVGTFDDAGLKASEMVRGLNSLFVKFAEAGKDPKQALADLVERLKDTKTQAAAVNELIEAGFSKRSAVAMADAAKRGALEIGNFSKALKESKGKVDEVAEATKTLSDRWKELQHQLALAAEPSGNFIIKWVNDSLAHINKMNTALGFIYKYATGQVKEGNGLVAPSAPSTGATINTPPPATGGGGGTGGGSRSFVVGESLAFERLQHAAENAKKTVTSYFDGTARLIGVYSSEINRAATVTGVWDDVLKSQDLKNLPITVSKAAATLNDAFTPAMLDAANEQLRLQRNTEITDAAFAAFGEHTIDQYREMATEARSNYEIMRDSGKASATALDRAFTLYKLHQIELDHELGITDDDLYASQKKNAEETLKKIEGATTETKTRVRSLGEELQQATHRMFDNISRSIARNLVEWKGWGESLKNIAKTVAEDVLNILISSLLKPLEDRLAGMLGKIGGGGGGTPGIPGGGGGPGGGAGAAGAASGVMGTIGAVSAAVGAVSSVVGNFQMAGMNKSLDVLVNHTLRTFNELAQFRQDAWSRHTQWFQRSSEIWQAVLDVKDAIGRGGTGTGGKGGITFNNCSFTGSPNEIASAIFTQAQLAGAI